MPSVAPGRRRWRTGQLGKCRVDFHSWTWPASASGEEPAERDDEAADRLLPDHPKAGSIGFSSRWATDGTVDGHLCRCADINGQRRYQRTAPEQSKLPRLPGRLHLRATRDVDRRRQRGPHRLVLHQEECEVRSGDRMHSGGVRPQRQDSPLRGRSRVARSAGHVMSRHHPLATVASAPTSFCASTR